MVTSSAVAMAAAGEPVNPEVLWYEAPWGVGYGQAVFFDPEPALYAVARSAVVDVVQGRAASVPSGGPDASGVFVTLTLDGQLRGCIGQPTPTRDTLYAEVAQAARSSATRDPRCRMISEAELVALDIEVSVLSTLEDVTDMEQLDPATWGIVVSRGEDRGLLLPSVQGVETSAQQLGIARRKAGIGASDPVRVQRFRTATQHRP